MKIGFFDPYLDTLGGGEKYILDIASCLSENNDAFIFWDDPSIKTEWKKRFNLSFPRITFTKNIFSSKNNLFERFMQTKDYDVIFYISDGSIPFLFGKKNILIFQFPVPGIHGKNLINNLKLRNITAVLCYSAFVKSLIDQQYGFSSKVIPPHIDPHLQKNVEKENIILTVGRFTKGMNTKKQEILIDEFKKLCDKGLKNWKFVLIGSHLPKDMDFIKALKDKIRKYPISLLTNISYDELSGYYQRAKIYWHAAGFGEDLNQHPERAEHFGISTVEAMTAGVVPVVISAGGQKEIVENGESGFLWNATRELIDKTLKLINDPDLWGTMSRASIKRSQVFSGDRFCKALREIIN